MKTRQGFVGNSSSTSFCIFGAYLDEDMDKNSFLSQFSEYVDEGHDYEAEDLIKFVSARDATIGDDTLSAMRGLTVLRDDYGMYVGWGPEQMKMDQTRRSFEEECKKVLEAILKEKISPGWITSEINS